MSHKRINAEICLLFSADCMSHMISGSITLTNTNLCYDHALQLPIILKPTLTCQIL